MRKPILPITSLLFLLAASSCVSVDQYNDTLYRVDSLYNELYMEQRLNDQLQSYIETIYYEKVEPNWSSSIDLPVSLESAQTVEMETLNSLPQSNSLETVPRSASSSQTTRSNARTAQPTTTSPSNESISAFLLKEEILFEKGSTMLDDASQNLILQIATAMQNRDDYLITIEGHTDNTEASVEGSISRNWELSTERASSIAKQLIANGVSPHLLRISGRGMFQPHASNHTPSGQAKNRRAEIILSPRKH